MEPCTAVLCRRVLEVFPPLLSALESRCTEGALTCGLDALQTGMDSDKLSTCCHLTKDRRNNAPEPHGLCSGAYLVKPLLPTRGLICQNLPARLGLGFFKQDAVWCRKHQTITTAVMGLVDQPRWCNE